MSIILGYTNIAVIDRTFEDPRWRQMFGSKKLPDIIWLPFLNVYVFVIVVEGLTGPINAVGFALYDTDSTVMELTVM